MTMMRNKYGFLFGADPELFVFDKDGKPFPAVGLIPGTKEEPFKVDGGAVQVDGVAAEFNIDPVDNFDDFIGNCNKVQQQLKAFLPKGYTLRAVPAAEFPADIMDALPEQAKELGCDPDYNAWTGKVNPRPTPDSSKPHLRTASGHLHIGWTTDHDISDEEHRTHAFDFVKQLDWYLGAWLSTQEYHLGPDIHEQAVLRRSMYGKAGACRVKPYGVEYRVPSNVWLTMTKGRQQQLWVRMQQAIETMRQNYWPELAKNYNKRLIKMIDKGETDPILADRYYNPIMDLTY